MDREAVDLELFSRLQALPGVRTASRVLKHWNDVPPEQQPAVFLTQIRESHTTRTGEPSIVTLRRDLYVYVQPLDGRAPATALNEVLDAITEALRPHPITGRHGGMTTPGVQWARIEGDVETDEGTLGERAVAIVPIAVLVSD